MYKYENERSKLFNDSGQRLFLKIRDRANYLTNLAGVARMDKIIQGQSGDSWEMLACVDRLVELGEFKEIPQEPVSGQHRVFYKVSY